MEIRSYYISNNVWDYQDYWGSTVSPPLENAANVEGCGCYIIKEKDQSDRTCVTYTKCYTCHYLCENHMSEHNLSKKKD